MFSHRVALVLRQQTRLPQCYSFPRQADVASRTLVYPTRRTYATPGRPRNVVGEPSRPVKRSAKRSANKATSSDSPAKEGNQEKKKKAAAKKKPAGRPKKVLSEEQKAKKLKNIEKGKVADLKKEALSPPKIKMQSAYHVFVSSRKDELRGESGESPADRRKRLGDRMKTIAAAWKESSVADIEHYNHLAHTTKENNQAEYKRWVESHPAEEIQLANRARLSLRHKLEADKPLGNRTKWPAINDERAAKRPVTSYIQFNVNRQKSGDFRNIRVAERAKLIGQEWKALSQEEKDKYKALASEESKRYGEEYNSVYGHPPPTANGLAHAAAAA